MPTAFATASSRAIAARRSLLLAGVALLGLVQAASAEEQGRRDKWVPHLQLELKPGSDRQIGQFELFLPVWQDGTTLVYANPRVQADLDDTYETNLGLGLRTKLDEDWILGGYAYFDYRTTENDNSFVQGTAGLELLSDDWGFRVNGYLPESGSQDIDGSASFDLASITVSHGEERALPGFDAELEYGFNPFEELDAELRFAAGGYYFAAEDYDTHAGPRLRAELRLFDLDPFPNGSRLVAGAEYQYDDPRGHQGFAFVQVRVPIQSLWGAPERAKMTGLDRRMEESVRRDVDIVVAERRSDPVAATFADGTPIADVIFLDQGGVGDGSSVAEARDLDDYFADAPVQNALHVVLGDAGEIETVGNQVLNGQVFIGGGSQLVVQGGPGDSVLFNAPGARPTLHNEMDGSAPLFELADRNSFVGLDFRLTQADGAAGTYIGIYGAGGNDDILLRDLSFVNDGTQPGAPNINFQDQLGGEAIHIAGGSNVRISEITGSALFGEGLDLRGIAGLAVSDVSLTGVGRAGILLVDSADVTVTGFDIQTPGNFGIGAFNVSGLAIGDGLIDGAGSVAPKIGQGINLSDVHDVTIEFVTVRNSTRNGILAATGSTGVAIANSVVNGADTGIQFENSSGSVTDVVIFGATAHGMLLRDDAGGAGQSVAINNVEVTNGPSAFDFTGDGEVTVSGTGNSSFATALCAELPPEPTIVGGLEVNGVANAVSEATCN